jgi:ubiquinone/menaquinone biosynthesis C-methylase UbiE
LPTRISEAIPNAVRNPCNKLGCAMPDIDHSSLAVHQRALDAYFREESPLWGAIYEREGIFETIHQERLRLTLAMVDGLRLPLNTRVLDVGCGAGLATVALARRVLTVDAIDRVGAMTQATRRRAAAACVKTRVAVQVGDAHALPFPDGTFALVVALGVLPWLPKIEPPLREMSRVLRPGGYLIATVDMHWQLRQFFDPLKNPLLLGPRSLVGSFLRRRLVSCRGVRPQVTRLREFKRELVAQGLELQSGYTVGFGPFTFFNRQILPPSVGLRLNNRLQSMANAGTPALRSSGSQFLMLAKKPSTSDPKAPCDFSRLDRQLQPCPRSTLRATQP